MNLMPKNRVAISIRNETKKDLAAVEKWLRAEHEQTGEGFFCNWSVVAAAFKRKDVFVLAADDDIVGFVVDAPSGPDIVEVRPDKRGMGYGRRLAEWAITSTACRAAVVRDDDDEGEEPRR
jgi:GNAT superfamily N-acetyltransferase